MSAPAARSAVAAAGRDVPRLQDREVPVRVGPFDVLRRAEEAFDALPEPQQRLIVGRGAVLLHRRFPAQTCKPLSAKSSTKDAASITTPMEAAPA